MKWRDGGSGGGNGNFVDPVFPLKLEISAFTLFRRKTLRQIQEH